VRYVRPKRGISCLKRIRSSTANLNGLVRQYVSKRSKIESLSDDLPTALEETLNFRPRKVLGFRTPHEIFFEEEVCLFTGSIDALRVGIQRPRLISALNENYQ